MADVLTQPQVRTAADAIEAGATAALHGDSRGLQTMQGQLQGLGSNENVLKVGNQMAWDSVIPGLGEVQVNMRGNQASSIDFFASPNNAIRCDAAQNWACAPLPAEQHHKGVRS